uniref:Putative ovule protein n=1 Tax=Solanum chacoense TaxID=4108 RepID=A0A0V0HEL2_SOLCH
MLKFPFAVKSEPFNHLCILILVWLLVIYHIFGPNNIKFNHYFNYQTKFCCPNFWRFMECLIILHTIKKLFK